MEGWIQYSRSCAKKQKTTSPGVFPLRGLLSSLFMGNLSPCGSPHMGKRELGGIDYIGDDDDQDVLAVTRLGRAQLAGFNILPVAGRDNIISRD